MASNAAVSALLKPQASHGRNAFPLDCRHIYSQKAGQITPVKCFHYEPSTYLDMSVHDFTMTFPMQTAPFLRGRKEFAFYSVYYNSVWSLFNQYMATKQDPKTSAFGQTPTLAEPRIALWQFYENILSQFVYYAFYEHVIPAFVRLHVRPSANEDGVLSPSLPYVVGVDNVAYYTAVVRETFLEQEFTGMFSPYFIYESSDGHTYDLTWYPEGNTNLRSFAYKFRNNTRDDNTIFVEQYCQDIVGHFRVYNWIRKLDMLGYGNIYPVIKGLEDDIVGFLDRAVYVDTPLYDSFARVLSLLGSFVLEAERHLFRSVATFDKSKDIGSLTSSDVTLKRVNLYPICAYNSVFYHFFRNSFYDLDYYVHDYNLDFVSVDVSHGDYNVVTAADFTLRFLDVEYHQWKKDTFTAVLPDQQFGAVSSVEVGMPDRIQLRSTYNGSAAATPATFSRENGSQYDFNNMNLTVSGSISAMAPYNWYTGQPLTSSFDVIALKRSEMLQEYRQQLMRAGNRTSDVFRAIYGKAASSEHEDDVIPRFLDTFGEDLFVDPVESTASTGAVANGSLGDIASRGKFRGDSPRIKFNAGGNFGLILCLSYVVPTAEYNSYMFDKHVFELDPQSHYIPQFENYGLEPVMSDELNCLLPANDIRVLGYGPRYYHKKSELDVVHGAFVSRYFNTETDAYVPLSWYGSFNNWVSSRTDLQNRSTTAVKDFYVNPSVLDNVFVRAAGADIADDQFICSTYFDVKATKEMSKVGLINFV